ncbi:retrovirus-related Pol polyprotein from transposon RE1 [Nicotiana tabacum]|uniref:Retrovirus-related Pol polyprotein from transposon RE1 n=1 Tax=Nicotiana tabacum TaxID=4097 RepID=A0AC58T5H8_TOBAC
MSNFLKQNWIIDIEASNHMTSQLDALTSCPSIPSSEKFKVQLPTGNVVSVSHKETSLVLRNNNISNVLYIPEFKYNLLSISQLTKELQCMVAFFPDFCIFQDLYSGQVKGIGKEKHGLYILQGGLSQDSSATSINKCAHAASLNNSIDIWHWRLEHAPIDVIRKLDALSTLNKGPQYGHVCPVAKKSKLPFSLSTSVSNVAFELVHYDIWGPYRVPSYSGKRYFVIVVDDYTRYTWIFLLNFKSEVIVVLRDFLTQIKNMFSSSIKVLRTDNGSEFFSNEFKQLLSTLDIFHQSSCVYTPQQNGVVERKHRTILDMSRSLRFQATIPLSIVDKFSPRVIPVVFLGYSSSQKGYVLYDLNAKSSFVNRNVVFQEDPRPSTADSSPEVSPSSPESSTTSEGDYTSPPEDTIIDIVALEDPPPNTPLETDPVTAPPDAAPIQVRKSYRTSKPPIWIVLVSYSVGSEPQSFVEAVTDPQWVEAMRLEIAALVENKTWNRYSKSSIRLKERLKDTRPDWLPKVTVKRKMDVHNAFLNGDLVEEVYIHIPQGFASHGESKKVCKLYKSLYRLKQAPRQWNMKLTEVLLQMGFKQSHYDYTLFIREANGDAVIILMYLDDLLITGNNDKSLHDTRTQLQKKFKMKDLGELKNFLAIEFARSKEGILMFQRKYVLELMSETGLGGAKPSGTPLELNKKLTYVECDKCIQITNQEGDQNLKDPSCYQRLVRRSYTSP